MSQVIARKNIAILSLLTDGISLLRTLGARIVRRHAIWRQRQMLHEMPNELLQDVGVSPSDIDSLAELIVDGRTDPTRRPRGVSYERSA